MNCRNLLPFFSFAIFLLVFPYCSASKVDAFGECLSKGFHSPIVWTRQGTVLYEVLLRRNAQTRFQRYPAVFVQPRSLKDASHVVICANSCNLSWVVRNGGHSYEAVSLLHLGVVIDLSLLTRISIDTIHNIMKVEAGQRLGPVYAALAKVNKAIPGGTCVGVGITGLMLGGGMGHSMRKLSLLSDALLSARVVLSNGTIVTASSESEALLFYAIRGGGPFYGLVIDLVLRIFDAPQTVTVVKAIYSVEHASRVLHAYNAWKPWNLDANYALIENYYGFGALYVLINYWGDAPAVRASVASSPLSLIDGNFSYVEYNWKDFILQATNFDSAPEWSLLNLSMSAVLAENLSKRSSFKAASLIFSSNIPAAAIETLALSLSKRAKESFYQVRAMGGALSELPNNMPTGWPHREKKLEVQLYTLYRSEDDGIWLTNLWNFMKPFTGGAMYFNYLDCDLPDIFDHSFGSNSDKLKSIIKMYDPKGIIGAPLQCESPVSEDKQTKKSTFISLMTSFLQLINRTYENLINL